MILKNRFLLVLTVLTVLTLILTACKAPPELTIAEFLQDPALAYENHHGNFTQGGTFTDALVIYVGNGEDETAGYYVVTTNPPPNSDELAERGLFVVVKDELKTVQVGDVLVFQGSVETVSVTDESGLEQIYYYIGSFMRTTKVVDQVDIDDPSFQEIIQAVHEQSESFNFTLWIALWLINPANPASPLSPLNQ